MSVLIGINKEEIINKIKKLVKEKKEMLLFPEIEVDDLSDECFFDNSYIIYDKEERKIKMYAKFLNIDGDIIENDFTVIKNNNFFYYLFHIYAKLQLKKNKKVYISTFSENEKVKKIAKKAGILREEKLAFAVKNAFYQPEIPTKDINPIIQPPLYVNYNGCYLSIENDEFNDQLYAEALEIATLINVKYIVFFITMPSPKLNPFNVKKVEIYQPKDEILERYIENPNKLDEKYAIINNLKI